MTVYPPLSIFSQASALDPHRILPSSSRTCHTKCGARHWAVACEPRITGSCLAAS